MGSENIWFTRKISYDTAMGLRIVAYNLIVMTSTEIGNKHREIIKIVSY